MPVIDHYVFFAAKYGIKPHEAHVLPALFEQAARKANIPLMDLIKQATYTNYFLGLYLAECAQKIALECPQEK